MEERLEELADDIVEANEVGIGDEIEAFEPFSPNEAEDAELDDYALSPARHLNSQLESFVGFRTDVLQSRAGSCSRIDSKE